jgi:hypothetical protein
MIATRKKFVVRVFEANTLVESKNALHLRTTFIDNIPQFLWHFGGFK